MFHSRTLLDPNDTAATWETRHKTSTILHTRMMARCQQFSEEYSLGNKTVIKTWGLSSFQQYAAACITLHPATMVQYMLASSERASIIFTHADLEDGIGEDDFLIFPWQKQPQLRELHIALEGPFSTFLQGTDSGSFNNDNLSSRLIFETCCASLLWRQREQNTIEAVKSALRHLPIHTNTRIISELASFADGGTTMIDDKNSIEFVNRIIRRQCEFESESSASQRLVDYCQIPDCGMAKFWTTDLFKARCTTGHWWSMCFLCPVPVYMYGKR